MVGKIVSEKYSQFPDNNNERQRRGREDGSEDKYVLYRVFNLKVERILI
jgi:hypothetical protein